jgi:Ni,Fe-hydrogenase III large subunit
MSVDFVNSSESIVVDPEAYRVEVANCLAAGWSFANLHVSNVDFDGLVVRTVLIAKDGTIRIVSVDVVGEQAPTIVDLVPAAAWDEREAFDLYGVCFAGHKPLRPLVRHAGLADWTVPVAGSGPYQVAVGPIHAGVIESGHFRFHVVGDRILHLDARLFYKHRGLEQAAQGTALEPAMAYVARACAACSVANAIAYAHACETALGLVPTSSLARTRTFLLELERVWNHLNDIAAICAGVGLAAGANCFAALTERARRLNDEVAGHRFLFGTVRVGRSELTLDGERLTAVRHELAALRRDGTTAWRELLFNASFQDRLADIGVITLDQARQLGTVGPAARAAGQLDDVRSTCTRLTYPGFQPYLAEPGTGDVRARLEQRAGELGQSYDLLHALTEAPLIPAEAVPAGPEQRIAIGRAESPRGATTCVVERDGDRITRLRLRTGSYANWPSVVAAATGNLLPDFPLINKSFELCYACADR